VHEILPPECDCPEVPSSALTAYEASLAALESGDWQQAERLLQSVPNSDRVKEILVDFMNQHEKTPPAGWDGTIHLSAK
jgi:hypothetical protein